MQQDIYNIIHKIPTFMEIPNVLRSKGYDVDITLATVNYPTHFRINQEITIIKDKDCEIGMGDMVTPNGYVIGYE